MIHRVMASEKQILKGAKGLAHWGVIFVEDQDVKKSLQTDKLV